MSEAQVSEVEQNYQKVQGRIVSEMWLAQGERKQLAISDMITARSGIESSAYQDDRKFPLEILPKEVFKVL